MRNFVEQFSWQKLQSSMKKCSWNFKEKYFIVTVQWNFISIYTYGVRSCSINLSRETHQIFKTDIFFIFRRLLPTVNTITLKSVTINFSVNPEISGAFRASSKI